jgi:DNA-binding NarL/FixJ family response regulator
MDVTLRKRILLVEDHLVVRESLVLLLAQRMPGLRFFEAASLMQAQLVLGSMSDIDLVLLDLDLPDSRGLATLDALRATAPSVPVVVLSTHDGGQLSSQAIAQGASSYIAKTARSGVLVEALAQVIQGRVVVPESLCAAWAAEEVMAQLQKLSERQRDVLRLLVQGQSNKAIALTLSLSEATVKTHVQAVFRRLNVVNRTQAVLAAARAQVVL